MFLNRFGQIVNPYQCDECNPTEMGTPYVSHEILQNGGNPTNVRNVKYSFSAVKMSEKSNSIYSVYSAALGRFLNLQTALDGKKVPHPWFKT